MTRNQGPIVIISADLGQLRGADPGILTRWGGGAELARRIGGSVGERQWRNYIGELRHETAWIPDGGGF